MVSALQLPAPLQRNIIYIPRILCYVLVVLIAITAAKLVWSLVGGGVSVDEPPKISTTPPKLVKPPAPRPDYGSQIARLHLMGKATVASGAAVQTQNAPDTSLNLSLSGVLALGDGEGFAIIANESKKHKFYQIDDEVTSGVRLSAVFNDYVLLDRGGRSEKLRLPKATLNGLNQPLNAKLPTDNRSASAPRRPAPTAALEPEDLEEDTSASLVGLRKELTKNPASIGKFMLITPENDVESGKFKGFRVQPNQESSALFYDLGLMDNDLVISINDITLDNPNKGTQVFQQLINAKELAMTVLRDGTEITLLHNLE